MKNFLVIGQPIKHSLSPILQNYWIKKNNLQAVYEKKEITKREISNLIESMRNKKINGVNITVPFKKEVIPYIDQLTSEADQTQSVNTIYVNKNKLIGHNTDIVGFENAIKKTKYNVVNKDVLVIGSGGVVPSIIFALQKMKISKITLMNRTKKKAENLKSLFKNLFVVDWGEVPSFDIIINATSVGLNMEDKLDLDLSKSGKDKLFYDVIYNPSETNFLKTGKNLGNKAENGKMMFLHQASAAFKIWHGIEPIINEETIKLLEK